MLAHTVCAALRRRLPGYATATPDTLQRRFLTTGGTIENHDKEITARLDRRAYSPVLRQAATAAGFAKLATWLGKLGEAEQVPVAVERPDGRLVDALLEAGHQVVPVKPNAIKTWREAEVLSGAKSDPGDAAVIADYLRVRFHRLRPAVPYSGSTKALRTVVLVRTRTDLVQARVAATNQLAALLDTHWPGAKAILPTSNPRSRWRF
ncbi:IS110 family transposase [Saccharopolyspora hattusasensis]|uniref:IS110 family transposase n=1 Tax=Saccharopolyspora hattusasensis TaxID=1128679 RepID=UPI003D95C62B